MIWLNAQPRPLFWIDLLMHSANDDSHEADLYRIAGIYPLPQKQAENKNGWENVE